ncbi:MAG: cobyrinic acid a,c-diamide synthase, partial [Spirochaetia bacterium]|nr:cobyrinic acid a,c-diamide synthase [Spirochaetia bacterium]
MTDKPQGRGYATLESAELPPEINTFWKIKSGLQIRAHEFHFSVLENLPGNFPFQFSMKRGSGIAGKKDGILYKNLLGTYTHFHCLAAPWWSQAFVNAAALYKRSCPR